MAIPSYHIGIH